MNIEGCNPIQQHPKSMKSGVTARLRWPYDRLDTSHQKFRTGVEDAGKYGWEETPYPRDGSEKAGNSRTPSLTAKRRGISVLNAAESFGV
jgi:hypothetical protein